MSDSVKFIFTTLMKVPILIFIAYGIFNLFAFCFVFFKMLGVSYVVMQTAIENNYLPHTELLTLYEYVDSFNDITMIENASIIVGGTGLDTASPNYVAMSGATDTTATLSQTANSSDARRKVQYGHTVTIGVTCDYVFIWPLTYRVPGHNGAATPVQDPSNAQNAGINTARNAINIVYNVPGLRYYPDLLN